MKGFKTKTVFPLKSELRLSYQIALSKCYQVYIYYMKNYVLEKKDIEEKGKRKEERGKKKKKGEKEAKGAK